MFHVQAKYTIDLFERMCNHLPPLLPKEIVSETEHVLEQLHNDFTVSIEDIEKTIISIGKKVWPYQKAFQEFIDVAQREIGEKFLLGKLFPNLKDKYKKLKEYGVTYYDLRSGGPIDFFEEEERLIISQSIIEVDQEIQKYVRQLVLGTERKKYQNLITEFQKKLAKIEKKLANLRSIAEEDEAEYPRLVEEIKAQIKSFEMGLCLLGPNIQNQEVLQAEEFFQERKIAKKLHRFK